MDGERSGIIGSGVIDDNIDTISETGKQLCCAVNAQYEQALEDFLIWIGFGILFVDLSPQDLLKGSTEYQYDKKTHMIRFSWGGEKVFVTSITFDKEKQVFMVETVRYYLGEK